MENSKLRMLLLEFLFQEFSSSICKLNFAALAQNTEMDKELWAIWK